MKPAFLYLCMVTFDGIHSERFIADKEEYCHVPNAKYVYVQTYNRHKKFDMERLWGICTDECGHIKPERW